MNLFKHKQGGWGGGAAPYVSPYLLEILSTSPGAPGWVSATGSLTAEAPGLQVVSCSRASSGYCLNDSGQLVLLGSNDVRVEPLGLLVEPAATNVCLDSYQVGKTAGSGGNWVEFTTGLGITTTLNTSDVADPAGGSEASKISFGARPGPVAADGGVVYQTIPGIVGVRYQWSMWLRVADGQTGQVALVSAGANSRMLCDLTDQWQRFTLDCNSGADNGTGALGNFFYADLPAVTVYAWQGQLEAGTIRTSDIRTTGASATRAADVLTVASPLAAFGTPTTWRASARVAPVYNDWSLMTNYGCLIAAPDDGAASEWALYTRRELFGLDYYSDAAANAFAQGPNVTRSGTGFYTALATVGGGNMNVYENGVLVAGPTATSGTLTQNATLRLGSATGGGITAVYPMHLTDIYVDNT